MHDDNCECPSCSITLGPVKDLKHLEKRIKDLEDGEEMEPWHKNPEAKRAFKQITGYFNKREKKK